MRRLNAFLLGATFVAAAPALSYAQGGPQLEVTAIANQGALKIGNNTFRVTAHNGSQTHPATGTVTVKLEVLDPMQNKTEYTATIAGGIGTGADGSKPALFKQVAMPHPGAYTLTAVVDPNRQFSPLEYDRKKRTQVFTVPAGGTAAQAANLTVVVKNQNQATQNGLRVALKTQAGQELFWKMTAGTGQAVFPKIAPSPAGKPYTIEVKRANVVLGSFEYAMPATDQIFNVQVNLQP
jgi:hypothetical protein